MPISSSTAQPPEFGRIRHARFEAAQAAVEAQLASIPGSVGAVVPLMGPTCCGKTDMIRQLRRIHGGPAKPTGLLRDGNRFAIGRIPPKPSDRDIHAAALQAIGLRAAHGEKAALVRERAIEAVRGSGIRILALDECNHCAERGATLSARVAADHLKTLVDETGVILLLSGLPNFQQILSGNEQLRDRSGATVWLMPYDWQSAGDRRDFVATAMVALSQIEAHGIGVAIDIADAAPRLYGASAGRVGMLIRLLQIAGHEAAAAAGAAVDLGVLRRAAHRIQAQPCLIDQFFLPEPPDDPQLVRAHAAILQEAGLELRPTTLAGLAAA